MIPVTVMSSDRGTVSYRIKGRFGKEKPSEFSGPLRPVVVWNITWRCNLRCKHCYIDAMPKPRLRELGTRDMLRIAEGIAELGSPLLILSGGEPLVREDFFEIAEYASSLGLRLALSTNGTLVTEEVAGRLRDLGFVYVGISIDSHVPEWHDEFRGVRGAFRKAIEGLRNAMDAGIGTGIRTTITRYNVDHIPRVVGLAAELGVPRLALYHLEPIGRAEWLREWLPTSEQYRWLMDRLIELSRRFSDVLEIETVTAPFDGIYIADKVAETREEFRKLLRLVEAQGGCGRKIVSIYPDGEVHPCQFIPIVSLGNALRTRFTEILSPGNPALRPFIYTHEYLRGPRCSRCPFRRICQGGSRMRALSSSGDMFGDDPYCSLDVEAIASRWGLGGDAP